MAETDSGTRGAARGARPSDAYRAPALEKGLDVLELLAGQGEGLTLSQIAQALGRSVQEVYRVVVSLERRAYVKRGPDDAFQLSMKLFDLAANHPPVRRLTEAARPSMQRLAAEVEQAILFSVLDGTTTRVIAVAENPAPIGFRVRLGTTRPLLATASGRTLLAFQPEPARRALLETIAAECAAAGAPTPDATRVGLIAARGYEFLADETLQGITDVSFPLIDADGVAHAALTMPFLTWVATPVALPAAARRLHAAAAELCAAIGGTLPPLRDALGTPDRRK